MAISIILILTILFSMPLAQAQPMEEQRKYAGTSIDAIGELIIFDSTIDNWQVHRHDDYTYSDIYFETPDGDLYNKGYALRIRRRAFSADSIVYGMQLKSEMTVASALRLEVEEAELDIYVVKSDNDMLPLTQLLETIFSGLEEDSGYTIGGKEDIAMQDLLKWMSFKAGSTITPFQTLRALFPEQDTLIVQHLQPILFGSEDRMRCHLYMRADTLAEKDISWQPYPVAALPSFFLENPYNIWVAEGSYDEAVFYPIFSTQQHHVAIIEFEVENKFRPEATGTVLLNEMTTFLEESYFLVPEYRSKYRQAVEGLGIQFKR